MVALFRMTVSARDISIVRQTDKNLFLSEHFSLDMVRMAC